MNNVELLTAIKEVLENTPEINLNNFDIDQVEKQNNALIEIHQLISLYENQLNEETRKDFEQKVCLKSEKCNFKKNGKCYLNDYCEYQQ